MRLQAIIALAVAAAACSGPSERKHSETADLHTGHMTEMSGAAIADPTSKQQGTSGIPAGAADATARLAASTRHGEWVKVAWEPGSPDSLMAWVVYPEVNKRAPVVVVIHEIFGLSTWVRGVADQLAADGYIAVAPDLLSRVRGGPSSDELRSDSATKLIRGVSVADMNKGVAAAANYGMSLPAAQKKYGVVGYCWGGAAAVRRGTREQRSLRGRPLRLRRVPRPSGLDHRADVVPGSRPAGARCTGSWTAWPTTGVSAPGWRCSTRTRWRPRRVSR